MRVRWLFFVLALTGSASTAQTPTPPPQQPQPPVFRGGIELLSVDATVVDREGKQVTDLKPVDFVVEVDGNARQVVSAEYIKLVDDTPVPIGAKPAAAPAASPDDAFFSTNTRALTPGRLILLLVDEGNIRVGQGRLMMRSAAKFVDGLSHNDRVGMVAIPQGILVDFTTNHERVREGLLATVGRATPFKGRFHISLSEAIATVEHSDATLRNQLMLRECGGAFLSPVEAARCEIEVEQEAGEVVNHQRIQTQASLRGIREVLRSLARIEGPKSVILISEGLVLEGLGSEVDELAAIAADVRASLDVMLMDIPVVDASEAQRPSTPREDRDRQTEGLEMLAGMARGGLHRVISSGDNAFGRIMRSIAGYYLLGVESRPTDRDGRRHRIQVKSNRRGVTVFSRRGFLAMTSPASSSPTDAVKRALGAPLTINDVPMRIATWTYKEPGGQRVRLLVSAEVERRPDQALDYTAGLSFVDRNNRSIASNIESRKLTVSENDPAIAVYSGAVLLEPGTYHLRFAIADSEGRLGSVERKVDVWNMNGPDLTVGDLLIGQAPNDPNGTLANVIEPRVGNGRLAAVMEVYSANSQAMEGMQATLDILPNETARPLMSAPMRVMQGPSAEISSIQTVVTTTTLPPGRYLARGTVVLGGKTRGHITRPFRVIAGDAASSATADAAMPSVLPAELLTAMLANLPAVDRKELLDPKVLGAVLIAGESARPAAKTAWAAAKAGKLGPAALEALTAGDQPVAAFLRGVDFFSQGVMDRAMQQLQLAMQQAPTFAPARLYLGAALAQSQRYREAASLLQSIPANVAGNAPVSRMAGLSWLHAGDAALAIAALEKEGVESAPPRTLALAYVVGNRAADALPLLTRHLEASPDDHAALLAGIYATFVTHSPPRTDSLAADRTRAQKWAKAYAAKKGPHQVLVDAWLQYLQGAK